MNRHARGFLAPSLLNQTGMTLIELMVAVALFALLGTLSYRGMSHLLNGQSLVENDLARWRDINRALYRIDVSLTQIVALPGIKTTKAPPVQLVEGLEARTLRFVSFSPSQQTRQEAFVFTNGRLVWERWPTTELTGTVQSDVLLEGIKNIRWRFMPEGQRKLNLITEWPPAQTSTPNNPPLAIEVELELSDAGSITRLFSLR